MDIPVCVEICSVFMTEYVCKIFIFVLWICYPYCFSLTDTGAVFTFGKSKIANNVPSRLWLKNDIPAHMSCGQSHSAFVTGVKHMFIFNSFNNRYIYF